MWKCKQCGSEILAVITGFTTLDKNGKVPKNTVKERRVIKYICECEEYSKYFFGEKLNQIAKWVDEE